MFKFTSCVIPTKFFVITAAMPFYCIIVAYLQMGSAGRGLDKEPIISYNVVREKLAVKICGPELSLVELMFLAT